MHKSIGILCFLFILKTSAIAQDSNRVKKLEWKGYVKDLQSITFDEGFRNSVSGNLIHNRINLKWKPSARYNAAVEIRNRLLWGEEVKTIPNLENLLENTNEAIDLSKTWISNENIIAHSNVERLWGEYNSEEWNIRLGRQRINWGVTTLWNPNDLFNTYNFLDFDYEERPGSDAVEGQYNFNANTNIEFAVAASGEKKTIGAAKLFINRWNYDFQFISGWYWDQFTVGAGWAGNIKDAGFKGELMYFSKDSGGQLNVVMQVDYMLEQNWYINVAGLFNSAGLNRSINNWTELNFQLTPQNLLPVKWASAFTLNKEISPLFSAGTTLVFVPKVNMFILLPQLRYNLATNLDVDLIWQSFFVELNNRFQDVTHKGFLRIKWSF